MPEKPTYEELKKRVMALEKLAVEHKRISKSLEESEARYRQLFNIAPAGIWEVDFRTGKFVDVNDAVCEYSGYSKDELLSMNAIDVLTEESQNKFLNRIGMVLNGEIVLDQVDYEIIKKDGRLAWFSISNRYIYEGENIVGATVVARDVTAKKQAVEELRRSEKKFRTLVNTAPYGIQLTDGEGKILFSNPAHHKIKGYADGELVGKHIWELTADDSHRAKSRVYYQKRIKEQPIPEIYFSRQLTKDGREIDIQINWDYIRNENGEVEGIISIISDITKQKELESRVQQAQKMESIGNLAGGIAHDFNNILFPIVGMSEILLEDLQIGSSERENAEEIYKAGKRGSDLVKQILAFSRQSEQKKMPTRIQNVLKEVIKLSRSTIPTYIEIKQDIQQDCRMVLADPSQIHQIAMNIITNAYHAVESTGGQISITLKQATLEDRELLQTNIKPGAYAVLSISDTGHGMSEDVIGKIFTPYFTTKEQGKGTGLGLAVVYGIVKEHGGDINVYSEIGKGSTFEIYLPLMEKTNGTKSTLEPEEYQGGNERILLVDDEESVANLEKLMLERMGYKVTSRLHSVEALEVLKARPSSFDLVITDMSMPNIPGDELARKIKSIRSDVSIIICTGFSDRICEDNIKQMGIDGLLMKPIVKSEMAKMVRKVLDEAKED